MKRPWKAVLFSLLLFLCGTWVVFDSLFGVFGERYLSVEIPDVLGMDADGLALDGSLTVQIEYRHHDTLPAGAVISQTPSGGSVCKVSAKHPDCKLSLVVSLGKERLPLPDLMGMDGRQAEAKLRELGFAVRIEKPPGQISTGYVRFLSPPAGTLLSPGDTVTVYVGR